MTVVYVDTSVLLKRVVREPESSAVRTLLAEWHAGGHLLTASSVAWLEVWRSLRRASIQDVEEVARNALSGIAEHPLDDSVLQRARRVGTDDLPSLDAIHLSSAVAVGADVMLTYDKRLAAASAAVGIEVLAPTG